MVLLMFFETISSVSIGSSPVSLEGPASEVDVVAKLLSIEANRVSLSSTTITFLPPFFLPP